MPRKKGKAPVTEQIPPTNPISHERLIETVAASLTPEQQSELVRQAIAARLGQAPLSDLLGLPTTDKPASVLRTRGGAAPREAKDYLGDIVDVTVVSVDKVRPNMARVILRDHAGRSFMWDATSANGLALKAGDKKRITATIVGREGGHTLVSRVRFYEKSAKTPVRFTR
jgi:hypothetical protein